MQETQTINVNVRFYSVQNGSNGRILNMLSDMDELRAFCTDWFKTREGKDSRQDSLEISEWDMWTSDGSDCLRTGYISKESGEIYWDEE